MTYGLKCWNAAGQPIQEVTDRLTRVIGTVTPAATAQGSTGTINISLPGNIFAYLCLTKPAAEDTNVPNYPFNRLLAIDNTARTIRYENINSPIVYGVY